jgi:two-component system CheB/CheR fusion protein
MSDKPEADGKSPDSPGRPGFLVVGIGGSAGGITALKEFFSRVQPDNGIAYVVIMHLSPQHESNLAQVLQAQTAIPVTQVTETLRVEPDHVYVIPPNKYLMIEDSNIKLTEPERIRGGGHSSIDLFFRTLADTYGKTAVSVILSGTGTDGILGLRRIKEEGGFAIAQDPDEAEYDSMPRNAINAGLIDLVMRAEDIPERLKSLRAGLQQIQMPVSEEEEPPPETDEDILEVLKLVRQRTGNDFTQYKRPTMMRRIGRRLQVHNLPNIGSYLAFLREHSDEIPMLLRDLLITVTNFFRDRDAFEALRQEAIPKLFAGKTATDQVRAWIVGCATGEEAYSIAILMAEYASRLSDPPRIQVFATDMDETAIAQARECSYPQSIALDVSAERLRQYFIKEGDHYRVKKEIRALILFAPHNVLRDPPFSKLDLVSCRNLLIYLNREMQEQILSTFHFSLMPGGYLFLGASESAEGVPSLFVPLDKKNRIFMRRAAVVALPPRQGITRVGPWNIRPPEHGEVGRPAGSVFGALHQKIIEHLAPPSVLINDDYEIVHLSEHAGRFLRFAGGEPSRNLIKVIYPGMRVDLQALLLAAKARSGESAGAAETRRLQIDMEGQVRVVDIIVRRILETPEAEQGYFLVIFDEVPSTTKIARRETAQAEGKLDVLTQIEDELQRTRDQLHLSVEQYETTTEELKASNEELQAMNEELRSTTEELETSKEELQSVNEELSTVNQELREKIDQLGRVNSDLQNLMSATDIGTIFLDRGLKIKLYSERAKDLFNITPSDIGRPLEHFTHKLQYDSLTEDAEMVLRNLQTRDREVRSQDGRWYLARMLPYRTLEDRIDGVVLGFVDITDHRHAEELRRQTAELQEQSQILGLANVFIRGLDDRIVLWNTGCERLYGYSKEEAVGRVAYELLRTEFPEPLEKLKNELLKQGVWEGELVQTTKAGKRVTVACRWVLYRNDTGEQSAIVEVNYDITRRKLVEEELRESDRRKDQFLATLAHELRNPLAAMMSSLELLRDPQDDSKTDQAALHTMERQFGQLMRLVDDLLDFERLARGKITLHKERITLGSVVEAALENSRNLLATYNHNVSTSLTGAGAYIVADRMRLAQVITNLLHNAAKFTPIQGKIELTAAVEDGRAVVRVRDTGQGIPPEIMPHVFDYFVQEEPPSEAQRRGLGVGLALARQLTELHDGTIEVSSAGRGKGSEFVLRIPLASDSPLPELTQRHVAQETDVAPGKSILVIDDEHDVADLTASLLRRSGHQVWAAYSGSGGIEMALRQRPDVALVDIAMPDVDGYEVARVLRREMPNMLLIAITGLVQESSRKRSREAGFDHHLAKPATIAQIEQIISQHFQRQGAEK